MDNATYDGVNLTPINTDEMYSRLRTTETKIKPSYELQGRADIDQSTLNGEKQNKSKEVSNYTKFNTVMIIMMVILLLLTLISIALSVTTLNRLQTNMLNQLHKISDIKSDLTQLNTTQLVTAQKVLNQVDAQLSYFISQQSQYSSLQTQINCGLGLWYRLIFLNMSDPSQECPPTWREYNISGVRACGRPANNTGSCAAIRHLTGQMYSRVCGRVIGYQQRTPDAFRQSGNNDIDLDGINITRGAQHDHIWSYVADHKQHCPSDCPCCSNSASCPPQSIGDRYYCESGNSNDRLWDGQQCEGTYCTGTNSPPWFSVKLPTPTTDAIEVSICCDQNTNDEDVQVELIEIYVQ